RLKMFAAGALGKIGSNHKELVPALLKALDDPGPWVAGNAAIALGMLGREPDRVVPALVAILKRYKRGLSDPGPCRSAVTALRLFGSRAKPAVPLILAIATDDKEDFGFRQQAIEALGAIGPAAKDAVPALRVLAKKNGLFEDEAAEALKAI